MRYESNEGRNAYPSATVVNSQSVAKRGGDRGYDAAKHTIGITWKKGDLVICVQELVSGGNCGQSSDDSRISGGLEKWNLRVLSCSQIQTSRAPASK
jgi:hypothetical protein